MTQGSWHFYVDGAWRAGDMDGLSAGKQIEEGKFVLGQKLSLLGQAFDQSEAFIGNISSFNVWDVVLDSQTIKNMSSTTRCSNQPGNVTDWRDFRYKLRGVAIEMPSKCQSAGKEPKKPCLRYVYTSMCACMYVCMYVYMYVYMYVCMHTCIYVCMNKCMYVCMYYVCMYVCMCVYVCMYVCLYVCACMYV